MILLKTNELDGIPFTIAIPISRGTKKCRNIILDNLLVYTNF